MVAVVAQKKYFRPAWDTALRRHILRCVGGLPGTLGEQGRESQEEKHFFHLNFLAGYKHNL
jgi:hypothetical protein